MQAVARAVAVGLVILIMLNIVLVGPAGAPTATLLGGLSGALLGVDRLISARQYPMDYQPRGPEHQHRKGKPCYPCIEDLEREVGFLPPKSRPTSFAGMLAANSHRIPL